jgi:hypothetical protein
MKVQLPSKSFIKNSLSVTPTPAVIEELGESGNYLIMVSGENGGPMTLASLMKNSLSAEGDVMIINEKDQAGNKFIIDWAVGSKPKISFAGNISALVFILS